MNVNALAAAARLTNAPESLSTPPEAPLYMPTQPLHAPRLMPHGETDTSWRLALVLSLAAALTLFAAHEMLELYDFAGVSLLEYLSLLLFTPSFFWISAASITAAAGAVTLLGAPRPPQALVASNARTAIVFPIYHERIDEVLANAEAVYDSLRDAGVAKAFEIFLLSDSVDPAFAAAEEAAMRDIARRRPGAPFFYRRRSFNSGRKAGNIAEFVRRWGGRYDYMIVFDADSMMTASALTKLVARMEHHPRTALIQTVPVIINARTIFARMQQFALRACGPIFCAGVAWWSGGAGNYWGHNAIIRTRAFAACAGLPDLPGRAPLGGPVLSHDFVEAAMLRRAGWRIEIAPDIEGSYEQCPPTLTDMAVRDRRWAQGSLQHFGVIGAHGFDWISRAHIMAGIMGYASSALWCLMLIGGIALGVASHIEAPLPFAHLDTPWVFSLHDPNRALNLFALTILIVLSAKWLALGLWAVGKLPGWTRHPRFLAGLALETAMSIVVAPIMMAHQASAIFSTLMGRDAGWRPQVRERAFLSLDAVNQNATPHMLLAAAYLAINMMLSPAMAAWSAPVALSLMFAPQIELWLAGRVRHGSWLWRVTETPEETTPTLGEVVRIAPALEGGVTTIPTP